jgi:hypothetical protein
MIMKNSRYRYCLLAALPAAFFLHFADAQVVVQHLGANDPKTEGFQLKVVNPPWGNYVLLGPVLDDLGRDAWSIKPDWIQPGAGAYANYTYSLSSQQQQDALTYGWVMSATLRLVEDGPQSLTFYTGTEFFRLIFRKWNGVPMVGTSGSGAFLLEYSDGGYHSYSLLYDAVDKVASLWVDGVELGMEVRGRSSTEAGELSLHTGGDAPSHIHWSEFSLTIIPEPATVALLAGAAALFLAGIVRRRWRKNASRAGE